MLNKSKGNMYSFVDYTWNAIKGKCSHDCKYCFMKRYPQKPIRLDRKEFKTDLGKGNKIFVGSTTDMFANDVPTKWICEVLNHCMNYYNEYYFQSKNPTRIKDFQFSVNAYKGTTIETNRIHLLAEQKRTNSPTGRALALKDFRKTFITFEPIMDFDIDEMLAFIVIANPEFITIGADSMDCKLVEPNADKLKEFIEKAKKLTEVRIKSNLKRINGEYE